MIENSNIDTKNRFVAAVFANDGQTIADLSDPAFELHQSLDLPYGGIYRGPEGFMQFLQKFIGTYDIEVLEQTRIYYSDDPDLVSFEFDFRAVMKDSGKPYVTTIIEPWQFRDGRVLTIKPHYFNVPPRG